MRGLPYELFILLISLLSIVNLAFITFIAGHRESAAATRTPCCFMWKSRWCRSFWFDFLYRLFRAHSKRRLLLARPGLGRPGVRCSVAEGVSRHSYSSGCSLDQARWPGETDRGAGRVKGVSHIRVDHLPDVRGPRDHGRKHLFR